MENEQPGAVESSGPSEAEKTPPTAAPMSVELPTEAKKETGGRLGLEPTRYGDWEVKGIATDF